MANFIERLLKLQRGDLARGTLLFSYLFLIIASYVIGKVTRDALFLDQFAAVLLPYADIIIAVSVGAVVAVYIRAGRLLSLPHLLVGCLLFFAANAFLFWWLATSYQWPLLNAVIYVWVGIVGVLTPAQVWTLANFVLTTREAKRVFALVGAGAITGWIFAGLTSRVVAQAFGADNLFLVMGFFLVVSSALVLLIWRKKEETPQDGEDYTRSPMKGGPQNLRQSLGQILSSRYLTVIAAVILLSSCVTTIAGWQFKAIAQQFLPGKDALAIFFGDFNFYAGMLCLATQLLLTSRVLRRLGIGFALFVVPVALLFGSAVVLVWGTLAAVVILKGSDNVFRYSIDKSSVELLYLPVPPRLKVQAKSFIDTVIWRLGDGFAGVLLLLFATYLGLSAVQVSWVNLVAITAWLGAALAARRWYVTTLRESIQEHRLDAERASAPVLDRTTTEILASKLGAENPEEILYGLSLFEMGHRRTSDPAVPRLLEHPLPEVRRKALSVLDEAGDTTVLPRVEELLKDEDLGVRTQALLYLSHHARVDPLGHLEELGDFADHSVRSAMVAFLAGPGQNLEAARVILDTMVRERGLQGRPARAEAARLIARLPDEFEDPLAILIQDPDAEVARHAIRAAGRLRKRRFAPQLIESLRDPNLRTDAREALVQFGESIVGTLRDYLADSSIQNEIRHEIPGLLVRIGTAEAEKVLAECLLEADTALRSKILSSLNKLRRLYPEVQLDRQMIETLLAAEIMGHYRSYQILGTLANGTDARNPAVAGLRESMNQELERIFRLLGLLFPDHDFHSVFVGVQSNDSVVRDNALELLDNILSPELRRVLVPLVDGEVSITERLRRANRLLGVGVQSREEAINLLMRSQDPWLKSCAAYGIGVLAMKSFEAQLDRWIDDPDPQLREAVRQAKLRLASIP